MRVALALLSTVTIGGLSACDNAPPDSIADAHAAAPRMFSMHPAPRALPALTFRDGQGRSIRIQDFRGKVVVLNLWATWCAPCRQEMPTLDRLQAKLGGRDFQVLAVSVDQEGPQAVRDFFRGINVKHLGLYIDQTSEILDRLNVFGLPATLLIDRDGRELGRMLGPTAWDGPEMLQFLRGVLGTPREGQTVAAPQAFTVAALPNRGSPAPHNAGRLP